MSAPAWAVAVEIGRAGQLRPDGGEQAGWTNQTQARDFLVNHLQADGHLGGVAGLGLELVGYTTLLQAWDMPAETAFVDAMDHIAGGLEPRFVAYWAMAAVLESRL
jgi:hypothetical protein